MSLLTGTASSIGNMLVQFFDFAAANGWVIDEDISSDGQATKRGTIHHAAMNTYYHLDFSLGQSGSGTLYTSISTGYTALAIPDNQPGVFYYGHPVTEVAGAISAYWFFESDTYLHVVFKNADGNYRHFHMGLLEKLGNWTGGDYLTGHYVDTPNNANPTFNVHSLPFDGCDASSNNAMQGTLIYGTKNGGAAFDLAPNPATKWYVSCPGRSASNDFDGVEVGEGLCNGSRGGMASPISTLGPSVLTGGAPLIPISFFAGNTDISPQRYMLAGAFPDVRLINIKELSAEEEYIVASDTWVVFPVSRKGTETGEEQTKTWGYAYKKVLT